MKWTDSKDWLCHRENPTAVAYCRLCGTAMVFDRNAADRLLDFGVSVLLYQSDVLMYDKDLLACLAGGLS